MRKLLLAVSAIALMSAAAPAFAGDITGQADQRNNGTQVTANLDLGLHAGSSLSVDTQAIGNSLSYTTTDGNITVPHVQQTNTGDQFAVTVGAGLSAGKNLDLTTQAAGNSVSLDAAADLKVSGAYNSPDQQNNGDQFAVAVTGFDHASNNLTLSTAAIGNTFSATGGTVSINTDLPQTNTGTEVGVTLAGALSAGNKLSLSTDAVGNNVSLTSTYGATNFGTLEQGNQDGAQIAFTGALGLHSAGSLSIETSALGNVATLSVASLSGGEINQFNSAPQLAISALGFSNSAGALTVNTSAVGNAISVSSPK